ncbi:MAG: carboxypeptidase-like regulatory domain-containing protein, partial [Calditrichota bacterium]
MRARLVWSGLIILLLTSIASAQTGKVSGRVTDAETGEGLPGVNVILVDTDLGAATDADGYFNIIHVPAGSYDIRASFIGYASVVAEGVSVNIDLTATQNFQLQPQALAGEEVVVEATAPVVQPDISANIANVTADEVESVPVAGVSEYINLQAGVEPGMS